MAWGMGGTTDWATDLQEYHDLAASGLAPKSDFTRNSNWTEFDCTHIYATDQLHRDVDELWLGLGADAAWEDVVRIWEDIDSGYSNTSLLSSVHATLKIETGALDCGSLLGVECNTDGCSKGMDGDSSGPAAQLIWISLVITRNIRDKHHYALYKAAPGVAALNDMENTFAPIPPEENDTWLLLIDLITLGTLSAADLLPNQGEPDWKFEDQDKLSNYMGQFIDDWANATSLTLKSVFDGTPDSVSLLGKAIADGKLYPKDVSPDPGSNELLQNVRKSIFGCAIPAIWHASSAWAFVINSGYGCDASNPLDDYLSDDTVKTTGAPDGDAYECFDGGCLDNKFSAPKGVGKPGDSFDGVTKEDLIAGAVRTYLAKIDDKGVQDDLLDVDVTTPGFIRIFVCGAERAFQIWEGTTKDVARGFAENYPCDEPPGRDNCGVSSIEDQTSDASPGASDCRQIIKNIEADGSTDWTIQVLGRNRREIAKFGGCSFGVGATKVDGNVDFTVGGQDVIDIINNAIENFENNDGQVGAKGDMDCNGNVHQQAVKCGIYLACQDLDDGYRV
ncbi:putative necrosis-inducing factor-domain-containing protein [Colletotrichum phormii]|uniref:Necrosis-inducing factor-domain-containing protein n=1 Tax=Colletotrichum phormii TaxID=359342 RepID=A0AAJ0EAF5_9PEZI|nr:putative necrosis-inducing factor-domain-containing protein [Colletotrichum phormii]KAK1622668.1 putative necrosis-inducing factor-domain-containing protein [Colletotrichum phormii]